MLFRMSPDVTVCIDPPRGIQTNMVSANSIFESNKKTENDDIRDTDNKDCF